MDRPTFTRDDAHRLIKRRAAELKRGIVRRYIWTRVAWLGLVCVVVYAIVTL